MQLTIKHEEWAQKPPRPVHPEGDFRAFEIFLAGSCNEGNVSKCPNSSDHILSMEVLQAAFRLVPFPPAQGFQLEGHCLCRSDC